jgi:hypothetical protein
VRSYQRHNERGEPFDNVESNNTQRRRQPARCWLRAVEWDAWPFFLSQPIVPYLLTAYV